MTDRIIRTAFHKSILSVAHEDKNTIVLDELGLKNGEIRADIAVLNGKLIGYEIKGERDTLIRFTPQVLAYSEIFENAFIIAAEKHLSKIRELIPEWWGIYVITTSQSGEIEFLQERKSTYNEGRSTYCIAQLLWKNEAAEILSSRYNQVVKSRYTRQQLYSLLEEVSDVKSITEIVLNYLKKREGWRTSLQQL